MEQPKLKVLMVSSDRQILSSGSPVEARMRAYGALVEELHIVLFSNQGHKLRASKLAHNVWDYPTSSISRFARPIDAVGLGSEVIEERGFKTGKALITTQDPFECGWVGLRLKKKFGIALEVQLHTNPASPYFNGLFNFIRKLIMKRVMKVADSVRDVVNLPIYVDRTRIEGEPKFDLHKKFGFKHVALVVSRLSKEKNIGMAIDAVSSVQDTGLVIVGDGNERSKFEETDKVRFVGWQEDLASYYKSADMFIQTSNFEGYGLSLVEAGLSGLPVISTPVGVANSLKNIIIANTVEEFAQAIESTIKNPVLGLKQELEERVLTKEAYLAKIKENWEKIAKKNI
ncbi:MAG: glycosyltransferase [Minisyncoccota bacterium]